MRKLTILLVMVTLGLSIIIAARAQDSVFDDTKALTTQQITLQVKQQPTGVSKQTIRKKLDLIKKGLQIDPNNTTLLYQKALIFTDIGRYQLALNITARLLQQDPTNKKYLKLQSVLQRLIAKTKQKNTELVVKLQRHPENLNFRIMLINMNIVLHNYKKAVALTKQGLRLYPNNEDLLYKQTLIYIDMEQYQQAKKTLANLTKTKSGMEKAKPLIAMVNREAEKEAAQKFALPDKKTKQRKPLKLSRAPKTQPKHPSLVTPRERIEVTELDVASPKRNFISFEGYPTRVGDLSQMWYYNLLSYGHKTDNATYILGIDHTHRQGDNGVRYRAEFYPKISKILYFHFIYAYANTILFPRHYTLLRANFLLPEAAQLSFAGKYFRIVNSDLWAYSIWLSKFFGHHWISLRPELFTSADMKNSVYFTTVYRYYFNELNHYVAVSAGVGKTPDLLDLTAAGFVMIHAWHVFVSYQRPLTKSFYINIGAGYQNEKYPTTSGLIRKKWLALIGFNYYFN